MGLIAFKKRHFPEIDAAVNRALQRVQEAIDDVARPLLAVPFLDGVLLEDIAVSTTATDFEHGLGRKWRGFIPVKRTADVRVFSADSPDETRFIRLDASGSGTVSLWVF